MAKSGNGKHTVELVLKWFNQKVLAKKNVVG